MCHLTHSQREEQSRAVALSFHAERHNPPTLNDSASDLFGDLNEDNFLPLGKKYTRLLLLLIRKCCWCVPASFCACGWCRLKRRRSRRRKSRRPSDCCDKRTDTLAVVTYLLYSRKHHVVVVVSRRWVGWLVSTPFFRREAKHPI